VRRELIEGRLMEAHFDLFPLPIVSTYLLAKEMGEQEQDFLKRIQSVYFS
jgi:LysR family transcriptional repressor of citA